ncbi:MAG: hypothetical protein M3O35_03275 [Acidobacteriota bacterium]|nr:hypothetical protein [Acidobacteriota bacterium]
MKLHPRGALALILGFAALPLAAQPVKMRISGPYTHDNLSLYLVHGPNRSDRKLITLDEAIAQHKVMVYETGNVNQLAIENVSDDTEVYVQSGDIVKGGRQDRTLKNDMILPSKSGKVALDAFCVEHGRWTGRGAESAAVFNGASQTVATRELKLAVKSKANQSEVWDQVAQAQSKLSHNVAGTVRAAPSFTSMQLTLEAPAVRQSIDTYISALSKVIDGKDDVVGYAFAINGKVNSADVYASRDLFLKLWPKLLRASAVEAVTDRQANLRFEAPGIAAVKDTIRDAESAAAQADSLTSRTEVIRKETQNNVMYETRDAAKPAAWVHKNYIVK